MLQYQPQIVEHEVITIIVTKINAAALESLEIEKDPKVHQKKDR